MKIKDIEINQKVTGFFKSDNEIIGTVVKKLKTIVYVDFYGELVKYDKAHIQFLRKVKEE